VQRRDPVPSAWIGSRRINSGASNEGPAAGHGQLRFLPDVRGELAGPASVIDT